MNHQPFENWLNSEEPLTFEQHQALQEHLSTCAKCSALEASWKEVRQVFKNTAPVFPAPGFTARWQDRLAEQRKRQHRRQAWLSLMITGGIALILLIILSVLSAPLIDDPGQIFLLVIYRLISLFAYAEVTGNIVTSILRSIFGSVPLIAWVAVAGIGSFLSVLWAFAIQRLTVSRRIPS